MADPLLIDARGFPPYDFGPGHPFAADRLRPFFALLEASDAVAPGEWLAAEPAAEATLRSTHGTEYIALLRSLSGRPDDPGLRARAQAFGLGPGDNPIRAGQHEGAAAAAGATHGCVQAVLDSRARAAFNPAGGLHHAMASRGSGFCLYNDLAVGIHGALTAGLERVAYVDFDVHHGDGVEAAFVEDPRVLTISVHEDPSVRWPGTGFVRDQGRGPGEGSVLNLPMASGTGDRSWQHCVEAVLRPALERFRPQLLVTQHGCDPHREDPLAQLALGTGSFAWAARLSRELADQVCEGRWVATGGGGYQPLRVLSRAFAMVWLVMSDRPIPERLPDSWRAAWSEAGAPPLPELWIDPPQDEDERTAQRNQKTLDALRGSHPLLR